jgi:hypothetical protein
MVFLKKKSYCHRYKRSYFDSCAHAQAAAGGAVAVRENSSRHQLPSSNLMERIETPNIRSLFENLLK